MYLIDEISQDKFAGHLLSHFIPFSSDELKQGDTLEVWGSSFNEGNEDYCEFRLFKDGSLVANKRQEGY